MSEQYQVGGGQKKRINFSELTSESIEIPDPSPLVEVPYNGYEGQLVLAQHFVEKNGLVGLAEEEPIKTQSGGLIFRLEDKSYFEIGRRRCDTLTDSKGNDVYIGGTGGLQSVTDSWDYILTMRDSDGEKDLELVAHYSYSVHEGMEHVEDTSQGMPTGGLVHPNLIHRNEEPRKRTISVPDGSWWTTIDVYRGDNHPYWFVVEQGEKIHDKVDGDSDKPKPFIIPNLSKFLSS